MSVTPDNKDIVEVLIEDINGEQCVILIGPEIISIDGKSQTRFVHEQVCEKEAQHIAFYYPNDSLFLFRDYKDKIQVARRIKRLYKNIDFPLELYKKILEFPVPLIISLIPDTFLSEVAEKCGLKHEFKHFRFTGEANEEVEKPTTNEPLIYNLCGCRTDEESLILDYEDLFKFLRAMLPDGLPNKLRLKLRKADSFLFLGFDFEKWYAQLLLQLLTFERKGRPKFALKNTPSSGQTRDFLIQQFQIEFLGSDQSFFDQLHEALNKEGLLRQLSDPKMLGEVSITQLMQWIKGGKLIEALKIADQLPMDADQRNKLLMINSRFHNWENEKKAGTFHVGEGETILNKITSDLLKFLIEIA